MSVGYIALETGLRTARTGKVAIQRSAYEELLDRALLDPEVAKTLAMEVGARTAPIVTRRLRLHLAGDPAAFLTGEDAENAPTE